MDEFDVPSPAPENAITHETGARHLPRLLPGTDLFDVDSVSHIHSFPPDCGNSGMSLTQPTQNPPASVRTCMGKRKDADRAILANLTAVVGVGPSIVRPRKQKAAKKPRAPKLGCAEDPSKAKAPRKARLPKQGCVEDPSCARPVPKPRKPRKWRAMKEVMTRALHPTGSLMTALEDSQGGAIKSIVSNNVSLVRTRQKQKISHGVRSGSESALYQMMQEICAAVEEDMGGMDAGFAISMDPHEGRENNGTGYDEDPADITPTLERGASSGIGPNMEELQGGLLMFKTNFGAQHLFPRVSHSGTSFKGIRPTSWDGRQGEWRAVRTVLATRLTWSFDECTQSSTPFWSTTAAGRT